MKRLVFAPLFGVVSAHYRRIYFKHFGGFSEAMAAFISTTPQLAGLSHFKDIMPENNSQLIPLIPQLMSRDPADFILASNFIFSKFAYPEINWNIGCPSKTVSGKQRGAGLLPYTSHIDEFLDKVMAELKPALSVKMRLGMFSSDESLRLIPVLNRYPLKEIIIHPRLGVEMYKGPINMDVFEKLYTGLRHPIVYNGDIRDTDYAVTLMEKFPKLAGLMIGRGALADPMIAEKIQGLEKSQTRLFAERLTAFHDEIFSDYTAARRNAPLIVLGMMKELWKNWSSIMENGDALIKEILAIETLPEYKTRIPGIFSALK